MELRRSRTEAKHGGMSLRTCLEASSLVSKAGGDVLKQIDEADRLSAVASNQVANEVRNAVDEQ